MKTIAQDGEPARGGDIFSPGHKNCGIHRPDKKTNLRQILFANKYKYKYVYRNKYIWAALEHECSFRKCHTLFIDILIIILLIFIHFHNQDFFHYHEIWSLQGVIGGFPQTTQWGRIIEFFNICFQIQNSFQICLQGSWTWIWPRDGHADAGKCSSCGLGAYAQICGCRWKSHPHYPHINFCQKLGQPLFVFNSECPNYHYYSFVLFILRNKK